MFVKICGLTTPKGIHAAVDAGADAIGLVFARSPRQVDVQTARALLRLVPDTTQTVAVFRSPTAREVAEVADLGMDVLQTDADWDRAGVPTSYGWLPALMDGPDLGRRVAEFLSLPQGRGLCGAVLADGAAGGGMGEVSEWDRVAAAARLHRLVLAGGLTPGNVEEAISRVRPWGVDVSSGVEQAPGLKDPAKVRAFVSAARATEVG